MHVLLLVLLHAAFLPPECGISSTASSSRHWHRWFRFFNIRVQNHVELSHNVKVCGRDSPFQRNILNIIYFILPDKLTYHLLQQASNMIYEQGTFFTSLHGRHSAWTYPTRSGTTKWPTEGINRSMTVSWIWKPRVGFDIAYRMYSWCRHIK